LNHFSAAKIGQSTNGLPFIHNKSPVPDVASFRYIAVVLPAQESVTRHPFPAAARVPADAYRVNDNRLQACFLSTITKAV